MLEPETVFASAKKEAKKNLSEKDYQVFSSLLGNFKQLYDVFATEYTNRKFADAKLSLAKMQSYNEKIKKTYKCKSLSNFISECQTIVNKIGHYKHEKRKFSDQVGATIDGCPAGWFTNSSEDYDDIMTAQSMVDGLFPW